MMYLTGFQKDELDRASFYLDDRELFGNEKITEIVGEFLTQIKDLNDYAKVSVAQLFHHLVKQHPIIAIDSDDEWISTESDSKDYDCYYAKRYSNLIKRVKKDDASDVRYFDKQYYRSQNHTFKEEREVTLPYLPPYERVVIASGETIDDIINTLDPAQRQVFNYLVGEAYARGMEDKL